MEVNSKTIICLNTIIYMSSSALSFLWPNSCGATVHEAPQNFEKSPMVRRTADIQNPKIQARRRICSYLTCTMHHI